MHTESTLRITAEFRDLARIRRFVQDTATALRCDSSAVQDLILAVDEAATNIIVHGYQCQPGPIEIEVRQIGDSVMVRLRDQAPLFDPTLVPPPNIELPLEQRPFGGMGIHMIRQVVDELFYCATPDGANELTLLKACRM